MDYHPVHIQKSNRALSKPSAESRYWRSFKYPIFVKEYAPITAVHFSPARPHRYAVTVGTQIQLYTPRIQKVTKTLSRFKDTARSGYIRNDGKLLAAADDTGLIQIFDLNTRSILRTLAAHRQPTHIVAFSPLNSTQLMSGSDDTTVRLWDVPSESPICSFHDHSDYVRTGQVSPSNPNIIVTGSYDRTVRLFDTRSGQCEMFMGGGEQFQPVEQVRLLPSATILVSTSGPILRTWDLIAGGRCLRALSNHQKTITTMSLTSDSKHLLTGSLDRLVKVYDLDTYKVVHTMRYPAPLLCLSISPDDSHIVAGMSDGTLSIRRKQLKASRDIAPLSIARERSASRENGLSYKRRDHKAKSTTKDAGEVAIETKRQKRLKPYDKLLKSFKYSAALDSVVTKNTPPSTSFALISELIHVDALHVALSGRDDILLEPILRLLLKHLSDPRFGRMSCDVTSLILDMYSSVLGQSPLVDNLLLHFQRKVSEELRFQRKVMELKSALDMVIASAMLS